MPRLISLRKMGIICLAGFLLAAPQVFGQVDDFDVTSDTPAKEKKEESEIINEICQKMVDGNDEKYDQWSLKRDGKKWIAVVAEEMESLNEQISEAAAAITDINDTVLKSVNDLVKGIVEIDEYLTKKVLPDYDEYAKLGEEYGDMAELVSRDMAVLTAQTDSITTEVQAINVNVHDISKAVADGANQVTKVNDSSMMIVDNMNRLTDNPMLKMVQK